MNRPAAPKSPPEAEGYIAPRWSRVDAIIVAALLLPAIATRFLHLGTPDAIVFDKKYAVGIALAYLHRLPFRNTHPPLPGLLIALSIRILGDHPWSWRLRRPSGNRVGMRHLSPGAPECSIRVWPARWHWSAAIRRTLTPDVDYSSTDHESHKGSDVNGLARHWPQRAIC